MIRVFFISIAAMLTLSSCSNAADPKPLVGAIRWDAWYGDGTGVNGEVEQTLSPEIWQERAPFFAERVSKKKIHIRGGAEEIRKEIDFAADAGLDYWSFCIYEEHENLSRALKLYLEAPNRNRIKFCMNLQGLHIGHGGMKGALDRLELYVEYMGRPEYQTVLGGRPLVYIYKIEHAIAEGHLKSQAEIEKFLTRFREEAVKAGLQNPYIVMQGRPAKSEPERKRYGGDAIGAYASNTGERSQSYHDLASYTENVFWQQFLDTKAEVIPLATAGFDFRPRIQTGISWWPGVTELGMDLYHETPTEEELVTHLSRALDFLKENPDQTPANTILVYAWNEFDEGGWLCPTLGEGNTRLEALKEVLEER